MNNQTEEKVLDTAESKETEVVQNTEEKVKQETPASEPVAEPETAKACECCECKTEEKVEEPKQNAKVMPRYSTPAYLSHFFVLLASLLLLVIITLPQMPFFIYGKLDAEHMVPLIDFPFAVYNQLKNVNLNLSPGFEAFISSFVEPVLLPMFKGLTVDKFNMIVSGLALGAGVIYLFTTIYSFVCLLGGIGRKHAVRLSYVVLVTSVILFALPTATFVIALVKHAQMQYPLVALFGILIAIGLVIGTHITYNKYIKNTITEKEAAALEKAEKANVQEVASDEYIEEKTTLEVKEDSVENVDVIINDLEKEHIEEPVEEVAPETSGEEIAPLASEEVKDQVQEDSVKEVKVEEPKVEETPIVEEKPEPVKKEKPAVKKTVPTPAPVVKEVPATFDAAKGLPEGLTELGDHAFSKNLQLEFAIIPNGIEKVGPACFANCLNLKVVYIPKTVKKISFNAFFACKKLTKITYEGSKAEWKAIARGSNWLTSAGTKVIICNDGAISVNPFH